MSRRDLERIRAKVRLRQYDMSAHAMEEMAESILTGTPVSDARQIATARIARAGFTEVEYLELRAADTLELLDAPDRPARLLAAAWLAGVRLIDNIAVG